MYKHSRVCRIYCWTFLMWEILLLDFCDVGDFAAGLFWCWRFFCSIFLMQDKWAGKPIFQPEFKGQLISKCPYVKSVSSKIPTKIFLDFCPEIFCSFLGASWKLFGLPGDLVSNIINKEGYWKPKKLPGSPQKATKNFRAEIQKYFRWYFGWNWFFIRTFWN